MPELHHPLLRGSGAFRLLCLLSPFINLVPVNGTVVVQLNTSLLERLAGPAAAPLRSARGLVRLLVKAGVDMAAGDMNYVLLQLDIVAKALMDQNVAAANGAQLLELQTLYRRAGVRCRRRSSCTASVTYPY